MKLLRRLQGARASTVMLVGLAFAGIYVAGMAALATLVADLDALAAILRTASLPVLAASLAVSLFCFVVKAVRWSLLLVPPPGPAPRAASGSDPEATGDESRDLGARFPIPLWEATGVQAAAQVLNIMLPALGGDLAASWIVARHRGLPTAVSLAAFAYSRFAAIVVCTLLAAVSVGFLVETGGELDLRSVVLWGAVVVVTGTAILGGLSLWPQPLFALGRWLERRAERLRGGRSKWRERLGVSLALLGWCLHATLTRHLGRVALAMAWTVGGFLVESALMVWIAAALGLELGLVEALCLATVGSLASIVSILMPGVGLAEEASLFGLVIGIGVASVTGAAAFVVTLFAVRWVTVALGSLLIVPMLRQVPDELARPRWATSIDDVLAELRG